MVVVTIEGGKPRFKSRAVTEIAVITAKPQHLPRETHPVIGVEVIGPLTLFYTAISHLCIAYPAKDTNTHRSYSYCVKIDEKVEKASSRQYREGKTVVTFDSQSSAFHLKNDLGRLCDWKRPAKVGRVSFGCMYTPSLPCEKKILIKETRAPVESNVPNLRLKLSLDPGYKSGNISLSRFRHVTGTCLECASSSGNNRV
ncbi:hypothetical protein HNY73_010453 [Argiope bruennichi]|uniref:Uncharacterized protein n=1 Tax=Argiope bruennichi TaxID=94029 RepID=A0A8T0F130_ARGBR|nr:hypothetical protein HNY73_010453 [Argiope bruennichi]